MAGKHILFEIGTMATGAQKDLAGYTNYERFADADSVAIFVGDSSRPRNAGKRPTRLGKPGGHFDSSLDILGESGDNRYYFWLEAWSGTMFAPGEPPIVTIGKEGVFIRDIKIWEMRNGKLVELMAVPATGQENMLVSFDFDLDGAKASPTATAIGVSDLATAFKVPFHFNLFDKHVKAPPWTFDDHRYQPVHGLVEHLSAHDDHDHENPDSAALKLFTHGGIHPDDAAKLFTHGGIHPDDAGHGRTHGGIHPPGVASFVIVEL